MSQEYIRSLTPCENAVQYALPKFAIGTPGLDFLYNEPATSSQGKSPAKFDVSDVQYKFSAFHENARESYVGGIVVICKHSRERLYFTQLLIRKNLQVVAVWK